MNNEKRQNSQNIFNTLNLEVEKGHTLYAKYYWFYYTVGFFILNGISTLLFLSITNNDIILEV